VSCGLLECNIQIAPASSKWANVMIFQAEVIKGTIATCKDRQAFVQAGNTAWLSRKPHTKTGQTFKRCQAPSGLTRNCPEDSDFLWPFICHNTLQLSTVHTSITACRTLKLGFTRQPLSLKKYWSVNYITTLWRDIANHIKHWSQRDWCLMSRCY